MDFESKGTKQVASKFIKKLMNLTAEDTLHKFVFDSQRHFFDGTLLMTCSHSVFEFGAKYFFAELRTEVSCLLLQAGLTHDCLYNLYLDYGYFSDDEPCKLYVLLQPYDKTLETKHRTLKNKARKQKQITFFDD